MPDYLTLFVVLLLGYLLGSVTIRGIQIGPAGVLMVGMVFGHFGFDVPDGIRDLGMVAFICSVGIMAGPTFIDNFRRKAGAFIVIALLVPLIALALSLIAVNGGLISAPLTGGIISGAMTSSPALIAAAESMNEGLVSAGYGITYPFGVIGVVLFVQILPHLLKENIFAPIAAQENISAPAAARTYRYLDPLGLTGFCVSAVSGILLGLVQFPLPGGSHFSLGLAGGPLLTSLFFGVLGHIGPIGLNPSAATIRLLREGGMVLFFVSAGISAGQGFVEVLRQYGALIFFYGILITAVSMVCGFLVARYLLKLDLLTSLGSICGGMTSTPALSALVSMVEEKDENLANKVSAAYAGTYPLSMVMMVLACRILAAFD